MNEIIETEARYEYYLRLTLKIFEEPLSKILDNQTLIEITANIRNIQRLHECILISLGQSIDTENPIDSLILLYLSKINEMNMEYTKYFDFVQIIDERLLEMKKSNVSFRKAMELCEKNCEKFRSVLSSSDFNHIIRIPFQRITKYKLLFTTAQKKLKLDEEQAKFDQIIQEFDNICRKANFNFNPLYSTKSGRFTRKISIEETFKSFRKPSKSKSKYNTEESFDKLTVSQTNNASNIK